MPKSRKYFAVVGTSVFVAFLLTTVFLAATGPGQRVLLDIAAFAASSDDLDVTIGRMEGSLFSAGRIASITLSDVDGSWAEINNIDFAWHPWGLFSGAVDIETVSIGKVSVSRAPNSGAASGEGGGGRLSMLPLRLGSLTIREAMVGEAVLGKAARLSIAGRVVASDPGEAISGALTVTDLDRPSLISASVNYRAKTGSLEIAAKAEDKPGGVLSTLLDMGEGSELSLGLYGDGPIDAWRGDWALASGGARLAGGMLTLNRHNDGLRLVTEANGEIARLVPEPYAAILAGKADLRVQARMLGDRRYRLESFQLDAPRIKATASGIFDLAKSVIQGGAEIQLGDRASARPVSLGMRGGAKIELLDATAMFSAKPDRDGIALSGQVTASNFAVDGNKVERMTLRMSAHQPSGVTRLLDQLKAIDLYAMVENPQPAELKPIAGDRLSLELHGAKSGNQLSITDAKLSAGAGTLTARGTLDIEGFDGVIGVSIPDAKALSRLAGRDLSGVLTATAIGQAGFDGTLALVLNAKGERIAAGRDLAGQLLAGAPALDGGLVRDKKGVFRFDTLGLRTHALSIDLNGSVSTKSSGLKLKGQIAELGRALPDSSGALLFEVGMDGEGDAQGMSVSLYAKEAKVRGKPLRDLVISYKGRGGFETQQGIFSARGRIGGAPLNGRGQLGFRDAQGLSVRDFKIFLGDNLIEASAALPTTGDVQAAARVHILDAAQLAPILGVELEGGAMLDAQLSGSAEALRLSLRAQSDTLRYDTIKLGGLSAAFDIANPLTRPMISGNAHIKALSVGENRIADLKLSAKPEADSNAFDLSARVDDRWRIAGKALAALPNWRPDAELRDISFRSASTTLAQKGTARLIVARGGVGLEGLVIAAGEGQVRANITTAESLSGKVEIKKFPASFADLFVPDMQPRGALDGTIELAGNAAAPEIAYKLSWRDASVTGPLPRGFPALNLSASGALANDSLQIDAVASGPEGLSLRTMGNVRNVSAAATLNLKATGAVPLGLANAFLAKRGTRLGGRAAVDLAIAGNLTEPVIDGGITASGASIIDPPTDIQLNDVTFASRLSGGTLRIETATARSGKGGILIATGTIGVLESGKLPVDLQVKARAMHFDDHRVAKGEVAGELGLNGDLNGRSTLSGTVDIARLDIQIPHAVRASIEALELKHKNAPGYIVAAQPAERSKTESGQLAMIGLSISLRSANRIFVTGRGLDAQLGGELQLLGSADQARGIGEFRLERGRLAILGRTLALASGSVHFSGDLDPVLNFLATIEADKTKIEVTVSGHASDPKFNFASHPELPQDEILALLLFNKSLRELSPLQIAQLASEVSNLSGLSGGPGILGRLKSSIGIDTLNVTTNKDGTASVSAGSYLGEKTFVGVEQGSAGGSSRVKVDVDITKNLKLRGETGADGQSKLGIGVEWEY